VFGITKKKSAGPDLETDGTRQMGNVKKQQARKPWTDKDVEKLKGLKAKVLKWGVPPAKRIR